MAQEKVEEFTDKQVTTPFHGDVATISLPARLPPFWRQNPRLWFAQFEAAVAASKMGEEQKFNLVVPLLGCNDLEQIGDIILNPPPTNKYITLKNRLISTYQESDHRQLQKLLSGLELGDIKPSQLLRKMRDLSGKLLTDEALKVMWLNQLPTQVRAVLSVNTESSLECLAVMADKMVEHFEPATVAAIHTTTSTPAHTSSSSCLHCPTHSTTENLQFDLLYKQIEKLTLEIAEIRTNQQRASYHYGATRPHSNNRSRSNSRYRSRSNRKPGDPDWLCYYHLRYGDEARRCESPCAKKKKEN